MSEILDRFWAKVSPEPTSGCWIWTAANNGVGYGRFKWDGAVGYAHRFAYEAFVGPIPNGLQLDHLCRVRACCNPAHLEPVTQQVNIMRGRTPEVMRLRHAARTHCPAGHEYRGDNVGYRKAKRWVARYCMACARVAALKYKHRKQAVA